MTFKIEVPNDTSPDLVAKIGRLLEELQQQPERVLDYSRRFENEVCEPVFTAKLLDELEVARREVLAGEVLTTDELESRFAARRAEWIQSQKAS